MKIIHPVRLRLPPLNEGNFFHLYDLCLANCRIIESIQSRSAKNVVYLARHQKYKAKSLNHDHAKSEYVEGNNDGKSKTVQIATKMEKKLSL